jgi:hypothetical protein
MRPYSDASSAACRHRRRAISSLSCTYNAAGDRNVIRPESVCLTGPVEAQGDCHDYARDGGNRRCLWGTQFILQTRRHDLNFIICGGCSVYEWDCRPYGRTTLSNRFCSSNLELETVSRAPCERDNALLDTEPSLSRGYFGGAVALQTVYFQLADGCGRYMANNDWRGVVDRQHHRKALIIHARVPGRRRIGARLASRTISVTTAAGDPSESHEEYDKEESWSVHASPPCPAPIEQRLANTHASHCVATRSVSRRARSSHQSWPRQGRVRADSGQPPLRGTVRRR